MLEIDGSTGEGGGQILRTSIALSALLMRPVKVFAIRAGRPKPGLKRQHISGIELTGKLVQASIKGLSIGNQEIEFAPEGRKAGLFSYDIGTAGSISLVLQAVLLPAVFAPSKCTISLKGGTDVAWSPPVDYLKHVFVPMLEFLGPKVAIDVKKRGHYPKGGGLVTVEVTPCSVLNPLDTSDIGSIERIEGISHCVRLPSHVAERQAKSAEQLLKREGYSEVNIETESYPKESDPHLGAGSGIVLWAEDKTGYRIGVDSLGARGKPAEKVGSIAARKLLRSLSTKKLLDPHLSDMLIPYLALAKGDTTVGVAEITSHLLTNVQIIEKFLDIRIDLKGVEGSAGILSLSGIGFSIDQ